MEFLDRACLAANAGEIVTCEKRIRKSPVPTRSPSLPVDGPGAGPGGGCAYSVVSCSVGFCLLLPLLTSNGGLHESLGTQQRQRAGGEPMALGAFYEDSAALSPVAGQSPESCISQCVTALKFLDRLRRLSCTSVAAFTQNHSVSGLVRAGRGFMSLGTREPQYHIPRQEHLIATTTTIIIIIIIIFIIIIISIFFLLLFDVAIVVVVMIVRKQHENPRGERELLIHGESNYPRATDYDQTTVRIKGIDKRLVRRPSADATNSTSHGGFNEPLKFFF
uniref:Uncharacterized protein n=1 Tax=Anopheles atroparvus TaxID=41427 RepID=A0A182J944_ANOAO